VIPALHVAEELRDRGADVLFVGTSRGLEARLAPEHGFDLATIAISGLNRVGVAQMAATLVALPRAFLDCGAIIDRFRPDVVFGVGGYVTGPVLLMSACKDVPVVMHEANAVLGFANRLLAPIVSRALVSDPAAARFFPATRVEVTGLPVNPAFFRIAPKQHAAPYTILITGGSQGSSRMNQAVVEALDLLPGGEFRLLHQTGHQRFDAVRHAYDEKGRLADGRAEVFPFISDMPAAMASADLIVSRAGASTLAELAAAGKAAILVPFPFASDDHQFYNATARQRAGAARVIRDAELTGARLAAEIRASLSELTSMEESARRFAVPDATERIADAIEAAAR
jgi:UDP-N-acetylglucosamine--N-acetylmuramyl-(pentapeptide) pyrophosphoryl-undecaprenol N-acetylglucosamine transferase